LSRNLGALTSWRPVGLFRPVMGRLHFYLIFYLKIKVKGRRRKRKIRRRR